MLTAPASRAAAPPGRAPSPTPAGRPLGAFVDEPERISRLTMDVNVWGLVHGMRAALPAMKFAALGLSLPVT